MKTKSILTALLLCAACSPTPQWVPVPNGKPGEAIDVSNIAVTSSVRRASIKVTFATRASWDTSPEDRRVTELLARQAYDCVRRTHKNEALTFRYADGNVREVPPERLPPHDWKPVSLDDGKPELDLICARKPQ